jgi:hypothetical protein
MVYLASVVAHLLLQFLQLSLELTHSSIGLLVLSCSSSGR